MQIYQVQNWSQINRSGEQLQFNPPNAHLRKSACHPPRRRSRNSSPDLMCAVAPVPCQCWWASNYPIRHQFEFLSLICRVYTLLTKRGAHAAIGFTSVTRAISDDILPTPIILRGPRLVSEVRKKLHFWNYRFFRFFFVFLTINFRIGRWRPKNASKQAKNKR